MVDKDLCLATLAGIDACLYELGKLTLSACGAREEDAASIASTLPLGSPWEEELVAEVSEPCAEIDVRNSELNSDQYMDALMDDHLAVRDDALLENQEEEDVQKRLDAGFRALDRHELGLKPCAKPSAVKRRSPQSKSAGTPQKPVRKAKKVSQASPKALAKAKASPKALAKAKASAKARSAKARSAKAAAKASAKALAKASGKASAKARAKKSAEESTKRSRDEENKDTKMSESELKKKLHSESRLHFLVTK